MIALIEELANQILTQSPGVVVRYRLLRDVLMRPGDDEELEAARQDLWHSQHIQKLAEEQYLDGSWGAFHSQNTQRKQTIPTTEVGVQRALALGLDNSHPILAKTAEYILSVMRGERPFPDRHEKNDRWATGMRLFLAATLSLIYPDHPMLEADRQLWASITRRAFQSGQYVSEDEEQAHLDLTGATVRDSYLVLNGKYQLTLLASLPGRIPAPLENKLLAWLWQRGDGIGYLNVPLNCQPSAKPGPLDRWLASLELLARGFPGWVGFASAPVEWLWQQQDQDGYWDFGPRPSSIANLPLSDSWRGKYHRQFDWSTRILVLLRRYYTQLDISKGE